MKLATTRSLFFSVLTLAAATGCSGSSTTEAPSSDAGHETDSAVHTDSGADGGGTTIAGSLAISVTVQQNQQDILGMNQPFNEAGARIELPGSPAACKPAYCIEAKTNASGVVTFMVDPNQGPYDITIANTGYSAVSILGVTASVSGDVILFPLGGTPAYEQFTATGTIDGGQHPTDNVQLDAWDWNTVVQSLAVSNMYSTTFQVTPGVSTPLPVAAMDSLADGGLIVNGFLAAVGNTRPSMDTTINIDFPQPPIQADQAVVHIAWPTAGFNAGSNVMSIGNLAAGETETYLGNGFIEQTIASEPGAAMFVGSVVVTLPTNNMSTATIQSYSTGANANLAPDIVEALLSSQAAGATSVAATDFNTIVELHGADLANGASVTVPAVRAFTISYTGSTQTLDTLQFAADSDYASTQVTVVDTSGSTTNTIWTIYAPGGTVATRSLPRLPTSLGGAMQIAGDVSDLGVALSGITYAASAPSPWTAYADDSYLAYETTTITNAQTPAVGTY